MGFYSINLSKKKINILWLIKKANFGKLESDLK